MSEGFDDFVMARGHALLRFGHLLCGNPHLAEDLVQEVLARVHRRWPRIEEMEAPEAYVRKAIVREYLGWRRRRWSTETAVAEWPDHLVGGVPDPALRIAARDEIWSLLAGLPRKQRAVLVLRYYADMTDEEIAMTLDCAQGTVRASASRAMARLRTAIGEQRADRGDCENGGSRANHANGESGRNGASGANGQRDGNGGNCENSEKGQREGNGVSACRAAAPEVGNSREVSGGRH